MAIDHDTLDRLLHTVARHTTDDDEEIDLLFGHLKREQDSAQQSMRAATTGALPAHTVSVNTLTATANGALVVDGVADLVDGDTVLVRHDDEENGPYVLTQGDASTPWSLTRASWFDVSSEAVRMALIGVREGTANGGHWFALATEGTIVLGTTAIEFQEVFGFGEDASGSDVPYTTFGLQGEPFRMRLASEDAAISYWFGGQQFDNGAAPHNQVLNLGWNCNEAGNRVITTEPVLRDSWESNFDFGGQRLMERHWQYTAADGVTTRRMVSAGVNRATHAASVTLAGILTVLDSTQAAVRLLIQDNPNPAASVGCYMQGCLVTAVPVSGESRAFLVRNKDGLDMHALGRGTADNFVLVGGNNSDGVKLRHGTTVDIEVGSTGIGFFAAPQAAKQTVTGSRGGNAALASLLTALANYGLITDSSSA